MKQDIILKKEKVYGFVDRGGVFREDDRNTFIAERYTLKLDWVSEYFNIRLNCIRGEEQNTQEPDEGNKDDETKTILV